jgi:hypothetical protein
MAFTRNDRINRLEKTYRILSETIAFLLLL